MTIKELLQIKDLKGIKLVAGKNKLNQNIKTVNIIENPDVFDWLKEDELLLSTGYIVKDSKILQEKLITELATLKCAGICFKLKRYFDKIPKNMIDLANKLNFPIITIPFEYALSDIIEQINIYNYKNYNNNAVNKLDYYKMFLDTALDGDIHNIIDLYANISKSSILIISENKEILNINDKLRINLKKYYNKILDKVFSNEIPIQFEQMKKKITREIILDSNKYSINIISLKISNNKNGFLVIINKPKEKLISDILVIFHKFLSLNFLNSNNKNPNNINIKLLNELYVGNYVNKKDLEQLLETNNIFINKPFYFIIIHYNKEKINNLIQNQKDSKLEILKKEYNFISVNIQNNYFAILNYKNENKKIELENKLSKIFNENYSIISSPEMNNLDNIPSLILDCKKMIDISNKSTILDFKNLIFDLYINLKASDDINNWLINNTIINLIKYDEIHKNELIKTLSIFFECELNISQTAKKLFIHRNTLNYRINKIKEILGYDFKNPKYLYTFYLAIKVYNCNNLKNH